MYCKLLACIIKFCKIMKKNKQNKSFFKKLFFIIVITYFTVFVYIEFFPLNYNNINNTRWYVTKKILDKEYNLSDSSINILFLGESRVNAGINLKKINHSWSFASGGSTSIEMYFLLEKYLQNYQKPDTVFLSISPRFLSEKLAFWDYAVRNDFYTNSEFIEIWKKSNQLENDTLLNYCSICKFALYKLNFISFYQSDFFNNRIFFGKKANNQMITWILYNNGQRLHPNLKISCSELNYETKYEHFTPSELIDYYFNELIKLCEINNIFFIFDFMPMNKASEKELNKQFVKEYQEYIQKYQLKYPKYIISDTLIFYDNSFFGDRSHLNQEGQKKYTDYFKNKYFIKND